ncbi:MAG TPA: DUF2306 domain-containing protein [Candidatus Sulfotelmatobacter sp.]|nr:DUF2306 domain-containing protein [Candidatus Sulfotelmatobacter sp.]
MPVSKPASRFVWFAVVFLVVIGVAAVTRRTLVLFWPQRFGGGSSNPAAALDTGFARHTLLTLIHILPGGLFLALAPLQFSRSFRQKHLQLHRWSGRVLVVCGLIIGTSALIMSYKMNIGGPNETAATTLFAIVFLICLTKAYLFIRRKEVARHREWMIRAYGVGLGVATTRPIVGIFFAFRRLTPHEFFGIAFWLGFTITFFAAEAWVDYTRQHPVLDVAEQAITSEPSLVA